MLETVQTFLTDVSRFWFILATLYILYRIVDNSLAEFKYRRELKASGQGAFFGYVTVVKSANPEITGQRFGLKWENSLGSGKRCDIFLEDETVETNHAVVSVHGGGAYVSPRGKSDVLVNGKQVEKYEELYDSDEITMGKLTLRLRMEGGGVS